MSRPYLTAAQAPVVGPPPPDRATLAGILSLAEADLDTADWAPAAMSCGMPFLIVPVRDRVALRRVALKRTVWEHALRAFWAPHRDVVYLEPDRSAPIQARLFAPALGIDEDPATGAAAVTLAGYLGVRHPQTEGVLHWTVEQGMDLGRPSRLLVEADRRQGHVVAARVGGQAVLMSEGRIMVPDRVGATG